MVPSIHTYKTYIVVIIDPFNKDLQATKHSATISIQQAGVQIC